MAGYMACYKVGQRPSSGEGLWHASEVRRHVVGYAAGEGHGMPPLQCVVVPAIKEAPAASAQPAVHRPISSSYCALVCEVCLVAMLDSFRGIEQIGYRTIQESPHILSPLRLPRIYADVPSCTYLSRQRMCVGSIRRWPLCC